MSRAAIRCLSQNFVANPDFVHYVTPRISRVVLTPDHILASGSLPPGFPMTVIDGVPYWDGGLFDNTPIEPLLDLLKWTPVVGPLRSVS
jgi:NTE family protein